MYTKWTQHLKDPQEKADFERSILSAKPVLERVLYLLKEEEKSLDRSEVDIKQFDQPNWAERQAFKNGYRASLGIAIKLVDLDQQKQEIKNDR